HRARTRRVRAGARARRKPNKGETGGGGLMRRRIIASVTSWCLLLLSLGGPLFAAQMAEQPAQPYRVRPGDRLHIDVIPQTQYTRDVVVLPDGRIYFPIVGEVTAAGKTVPELTDIIQRGLAKELRNHTVTIGVEPREVAPGAQPRVTLMGEVRQ